MFQASSTRGPTCYRGETPCTESGFSTLRWWSSCDGRAAVDLFASRENAKCPLFFSLGDANASLGVDALAHPWPTVLLYAFPPISLISPTLARVREQRLSLILIAPCWLSKPWMAEIVQLLWDNPWPLPLRRDLLCQAGGEIFHPHPDRVALWAWPVKVGT
ncbi:unnamed protein product [Knipowitschia caucasica]